MMRQGYTMVWFGWQPDVMPGNSRVTMTVPAARNADGSPITGIVRAELVLGALAREPVKTLNLSSGWFTGMFHASYPTASTDNRKPFDDGFLPTLTVRAKEQDARVAIPNTEWSFGACPDGGAVTMNDTQICYPAGFQLGRLYELIYRAKDPLVLGLGYAAARDLGSFLKNRETDDAGTANPVYRAGNKAILMGTSQSGRYVRSFIQLGFNQDEDGRQAFEGAYPHIGGGLMPLNVRFGQPGRAWGDQVDHLYPAYDFPFTYARQRDPLTGREQGVLDRCQATNTCPLIFHVATALEMWEGRQSLGLTDPLGRHDVPDPVNVRTFILASTQHGAAQLPLPNAQPFGICQQQPNPNPHTWTMRALLAALTGWVQGRHASRLRASCRASPTARWSRRIRCACRRSRRPTTARSRARRCATSPCTIRCTCSTSARSTGRQRRAASSRSSRRASARPPMACWCRRSMPTATIIGGVRSLHVRVPLGTYTGWNLRPQGPVRGWLLLAAGQLHPVRLDPAGTAGGQGPAPLDRGALPEQGGLCRQGEAGGRRARRAAPAAAGGFGAADPRGRGGGHPPRTVIEQLGRCHTSPRSGEVGSRSEPGGGSAAIAATSSRRSRACPASRFR